MLHVSLTSSLDRRADSPRLQLEPPVLPPVAPRGLHDQGQGPLRIHGRQRFEVIKLIIVFRHG